ncbi:LysR family transcriptional regulator [Microbulbifer sp. SH-1]|uniref:LysR family transcriptional regulator n=1 Tax=Microbulbifer sp. SH-1 TaxID=2681547 RepID=UPI001407A45B|nr:LysR family transcriptional regulator [Microbulbifer sp. SH-1]QIL89057.1 LysR family transcriptional regulator [Microbulbifer sp. SH-1]
MDEPLHLQLPNLYVFQQVAKRGSFQAAADHLQLSRSAVSKKVAQLEGHLSQRLLQRSTRKLRLTEIGESLLKATATLEQLVFDTEQLRLDQQQQPSGSVKISSSTLITQRLLLPILPALKTEFPRITLDLNIDDQQVDLIETGVDIAVRIGHLPDSSLVARQIGVKTWGYFASPAYLRLHGEPVDPSQLRDHQCLVFRSQQLNANHWPFVDPEAPAGAIESLLIEPAVTSDNASALVEMATMGLGIIQVDPLIIELELTSGALVPVLRRWRHPESAPIHLVCLGRKARNRSVDAVWEFLGERLSLRAVDTGIDQS